MLYVFHVDTGTMMTFDINLALESVSSLKLMIEKVCHISANSLVLLVSGGEVLRSDVRVCLYSAGTDTNPIFMFSKSIIESSEPPVSTIDYGPDVDLSDQVETCLKMATASTNYSTVVACSQLAQQFSELAREHTHVCEKLVHDQHLQHLGWSAVVANMEDVAKDFQERAEDFEQKFKEHLNKRDEYIKFLSKFNEDLEYLSKIPILPALRLNAASNPFTAFDDLHVDSESYYENQHMAEDEEEDMENKMPSLEEGQKEHIDVTIIQTDIQVTTSSNDGSSKTSSLQGAGGSTASEGDEGIETSQDGQELGQGARLVRGRARQSTREALTLLHWITAKENQESLKDIAKYCKKALEVFDSNVMPTLRVEVGEVLQSARQDVMKKIKGLEERLIGLEKLMREAKRIEQEQKDLAQSFLQNQQKAANLGDVSVLKMLCESHGHQLQSMLKNQNKLRDVRTRCARAKEELSTNLYQRLKWIVYIENRMFETDSRLMFYHRALARLKRHLAVIEQLHKAPSLFLTAVYEVIRRRTFSNAFLTWASDVAKHLLTIHTEEVSRRRSFNALFSGHFLRGLFPGTEDTPPNFATQAPAEFDTRLPKLSQSDLQVLAAKLPNLAPDIPPCDMTNVTQFFVQRSGPPVKPDPPPVDERLLSVKEAGLDRGFESETDTEEYEKLGQSPTVDRKVAATTTSTAAPPPTSTDATTLTEENLESQRNEVSNLKDMLASVTGVCSQSICVLRSELGKLKKETVSNQTTFRNDSEELLSAWDQVNTASMIREREALQRLTVDHELELNDIKNILNIRENEIRTLQLDRSLLESEHCLKVVELNGKIRDLEDTLKAKEESVQSHHKKLEELELSKQKSLKELQEKMAQEYKAEIESLRSRFRLVALTSMDRSPSESSLEKIERADMIEITNHKSILAQTKEDLEIEKEEAIKLALDNLEAEWKAKMAEELEKMRIKVDSEKQINISDAVRRIIDEKDRQLEQSRERETILLRECMKYKETIQQLSDPETGDFQSMSFLQARLDTLEAEKAALENKLKKQEESKKDEKEQQTDQVELKDSSTNPDSKSRQRWLRSHAFGLPLATFSSTSCSVGDTVMITYDHDFNNFSVLQESPSVFLLHIDCMSTLDLRIPAKDEERLFFYIGKVENKDYCVAVKSRNRYNVGLGSRFYRVKVRPLKPAEIPWKGQALCCDISLLKEKDSSQRKSVSGPGSAVVSGSSAGTTPRSKDANMAKSVCPIPSEPSTSAPRRSDEASGDVLISEEAECTQAQGEQLDSIELNNPPNAEEQQLMTTARNMLEESTRVLTANFDNSVVVNLLTALPAPPEENVPYEVSLKNESDALSSEQFVSEVAEEATP